MKKIREIIGFSILMLVCICAMVASIYMITQLSSIMEHMVFGLIATCMYLGSVLFAIEIKEISESRYPEPPKPTSW